MAQDAELIVIAKEKFHTQDSASGAVLAEFEPWGAFAFIGESSTGSILANPVPFVTEPDMTTTQFEFSEDDGWDIEEDYDDKATLDLEAPNGTYTIHYTGATQGAITRNLTIEGDLLSQCP